MAEARRNVLVVGATGKQGSAVIHHLLAQPRSATTPDWRVWALTRGTSSPAARKLQSDGTGRLELVEGDLEDAARIRSVFETVAAADGGLWGVFVAITFPGLGVKDDRERVQGIV